jgi:hypothetical protein
MSLLLFSGLVMLVMLLAGRRGAPAYGAARLRAELDALYGGAHELRVARASEFPHADLAFYDGSQRTLEALGFRALGDVEDVTMSRVYPELRTFVRVMADDAALVRAGIYHLRPNGGLARVLAAVGAIPRHVRVVELVTEVPRGRFLVTAPTRGLDPLEPAPEVALERLPPGTPITALVLRHRERVAEHLRRHPVAAPVAQAPLDAALASVQRGHEAASAHRQRLGRLSRDELERMTGRPLGPDEQAILREVQRRPPGADDRDG